MELSKEELDKKSVPELVFIYKQQKAKMRELQQEREKLETQLKVKSD